MREYIDLSVLANWVCMLRADVDGAIWLADDEEDGRFYERLAHPSGRVVPSPTMAIRVLQQVEERGARGVVATVRGAMHPELDRENVFRPSVGDTASLVVASHSCVRVIEDVCGTHWLRASDQEVGTLRNRIIAVACFLERLNEACTDENVSVLASIQVVSELARWDVLELDWDRVATTLNSRGLSVAVLERVRAFPYGRDSSADIRECDGWHAVELLAAATRLFRPRGIRANRAVTAGELISLLRVAFDLEELSDDPMFWRMKRWERANNRYALLKSWRVLDPLGVVMDQRYWERDLAYILQSLERNEPMAAFKMDLDNFRNVNNRLGHAAGDEAIRLYCSIVKRVLTGLGEVYRRGGDEVVAFAPGVNSEAAGTLGEKIRAEVESEFHSWAHERGLETSPTASIGVISVVGERSSPNVTTWMDDAQHEAKEQGKNRVVLWQR
jgi:diguanylate cyclase (GGDEF)-like protein